MRRMDPHHTQRNITWQRGTVSATDRARLFNDAGMMVITAFISPYLQDRAMARDMTRVVANTTGGT